MGESKAEKERREQRAKALAECQKGNHPKGAREYLGYMTRCKLCGARVL